MLVSCGDMIYDESDQVTYADKEHLTSDADTLWSVAGIINKMQVIADRTILLGEMRGDLVDITSNSSADLRELAFFNISRGNRYNVVRDYYAIINNCNYYIAKADTALRNNRNERVFMKEYAAVKAFRPRTTLSATSPAMVYKTSASILLMILHLMLTWRHQTMVPSAIRIRN